MIASPGSTPAVVGDAAPASANLLEVDNLRVAIPTRRGRLHPVEGLSFALKRGQRLALVGESGSGKSLTALAIMRLLPRGIHVESGAVRLDGIDLLGLTDRQMSNVRGARIALVGQNPMSALNPLQSIGRQLGEALRMNATHGWPATRARATQLLEEVGIANPAQRLRDYPHQLSGGMRQRVVIAIALARNPDIIVADEPTTALDVTTQKRIVRLLLETVIEREMAVIFITHDLGVASEVCTDVQVMYAGRAVEAAPASTFFRRPIHPYSAALLASVCRLTQPLDQALLVPSGTPPTLGAIPSGCPYHPRCPFAVDVCSDAFPPEVSLTDPGSFAACQFAVDRLRVAEGTA